MSARKLILVNPLCPGDCLVMTAALECLHQQHPGKYLTDVDCTCQAIYQNNPHVTKGLEGAERVFMEYPLINQSTARPVHFMEGYVHFLASKLGIKLELTVPRPSLYLSDQEKGWVNQVEEHNGYRGKFWLVCSGVKTDFVVKGWGQENYQRVVDRLAGAVQFVQVGESGHNHPPLKGVINLVGKTDARQLIRLAYHAQGGLGGVSFLHHLMAAFEKPMVTLASGMEPVAWERYQTGVFLHKGACVPCGKVPCWKARVVPLKDGDHKDKNLCSLPVTVGADTIPKCQALISVDEVVSAIESYYRGGVLTY